MIEKFGENHRKSLKKRWNGFQNRIPHFYKKGGKVCVGYAIPAKRFSTKRDIAWEARISHSDITHKRIIEEERLHRERIQSVLEMAGAVCHEITPTPSGDYHVCTEILLNKMPENHELYPTLQMSKDQVDRIAKITGKLQNNTPL